MLNNPKLDAFERWYHRHHAPKRVTRSDVAGSATAAESKLQVDDGTTYAVTLDGGEFKIDGVRILIADVIWNRGVIHILSEELR